MELLKELVPGCSKVRAVPAFSPFPFIFIFIYFFTFPFRTPNSSTEMEA